MNKDEKLKALDAALTQIEKAYGKGSVMKLGDSRANMNIETIPTGSISLDIALGLGGVPKGRIIEVLSLIHIWSIMCIIPWQPLPWPWNWGQGLTLSWQDLRNSRARTERCV